MARKIRFPLKMKNGTEVRSIDELKENFDLESVLGYFADGKLQTWLADRYYDEKAEAVAALSKDMPDLNEKLCEILEVEYQAENDSTDLEYIQRRNEKIRIISAFTDDKEILDNIDLVAFDQDDLYDILDESPEKVYLYGENFRIPFRVKDTCYIGINDPNVTIESDKGISQYEEAGIKFKNVKFEGNINPYVTSGEELFLEGKYQEAFPLIEQAANNGNPRAMYIMARYYFDGYETVKINKKERNKWCEKASQYNEPLSMYGYACWCIKDGSDEQKKIYSQIFNKIKTLADSGDIIAGATVGVMFDNSYGVGKDYSKAVEWYRKAAEQGSVAAQRNLGYMYDMGYGIGKDKTKAVEWYRKAAEQGSAAAQCNLGYMYDMGYGIGKDKTKAVEWYRKAAEQGNACAQSNLGTMYENGYGIEQDTTKAIEWYREAANQDYLPAIEKLTNVYENKYDNNDYADIMDKYEIRKLLYDWAMKGAELGSAKCQYRTGINYYLGTTVNSDYNMYIYWMNKAVEQNYAEAMNDLGSTYEGGCTGPGGSIESNREKALELFRRGAELGNIGCINRYNALMRSSNTSQNVQSGKRGGFFSGLFGL